MDHNLNAARQARRLSIHMQRLYERYDLLNEACYNLRWATDALARSREASCADNLEALEQIAAEVGRDRDEVHARLEQLEALEQRSLCREGAV